MEEHIAAKLSLTPEQRTQLRANLEDASYAALLAAAVDCLSPQMMFVARRLAAAPRCEIDARFASSEYGAEVGSQTAVQWFAYGGRWSTPQDPYLIPLAVQAGADVNQVILYHRTTDEAEHNTCPRTLLGVAAELGSIELATRLLDLGVNPSPTRLKAFARAYETPLMIAVRASDRAMVQLLLERGADPTENGEPLVGALGIDLDLARVLFTYGADWRRCDFSAVARLSYPGFEWFVNESGYAPGVPFSEGKSLAEVVAAQLRQARRERYWRYAVYEWEQKVLLLNERGAGIAV